MSASPLSTNRLRRVDRGDGWTSWVDPSRNESEPSPLSLGQPGLWRTVRAPSGQRIAAFDCPSPAVLAPAAGGELEAADMARLEGDLVDWMMTTSAGEEPQPWVAPPHDEVSSWFDERQLSVRAGEALTRGRIDHESDRLQIRFPDLVRFDERLSSARLEWLREFCLDAQSHWQLVRFGLAGQGVSAEVDLTGAPLELLPPLTVWAVEALRVSVGWALPGCALLTDPELVCPLLDAAPWWSGDRLWPTAGPKRSPDT